MKLKQGQKAPLFSTPDALGYTIDLNAYQGHKVMISFYRFASCPFCNLRIQHLLKQ
ncbi:redoxin domain-containing protein [Cohnella sp.]|uniref:redoxin domain-containing protein n=1 Tax=Cohnella sp. TaxID=1883426 RepID=UPI003568AC6E